MSFYLDLYHKNYVNLSGLVRIKIAPLLFFLFFKLLICPLILTGTRKNTYLMSIYLDWYKQKLPPPPIFFVNITSLSFYLDCYHENRKIFFLTFIHEHENYRHMKIHSWCLPYLSFIVFFYCIDQCSAMKKINLMSIYLKIKNILCQFISAHENYMKIHSWCIP